MHAQIAKTMLRTIDGVSRAAVLDGYSSRTAQVREFGRFNLIYGWNASGKTTLSRVFGLLEAASSSRLPTGAYARFGIEGGILDTRTEADRNRLHVRVFNRDFIEDNLNDHHTAAPALLIVGSDSIRLSNRIAQLGKRREQVAGIFRAARDCEEKMRKAREKAATDLATDCGTALGVRAFRSPDLKKFIASIAGKECEYLLDADALETAIAAARNQEQFAYLPNPLMRPPSQLPVAADFADLLRKTPKQSALRRLSENRELSNWVRDGLRFHEHGTNCAFCGSDASGALEEYAKHFSDEYQRQYAAITTAIQGLEKPQAAPALPHEKDWTPALRERLKDASEAMQDWYESEQLVRQAWRDQLQKKLGSMEVEMVVLDTAADRLERLQSVAAELNALVGEHNEACKELSTNRTKAAEMVKLHYAARYVLDAEAAEQEVKLTEAIKHLDRVKGIGKRIGEGLSKAKDALQKGSVAATEINGLLRKILGSRVSVEQAEEGHLRFMRSGELASNLSDGERTAVSLAYFLVTLKQNGQALAETIVFIDDPICSLDANHIYDVAYLLLRQLGDCKQFFISTHNSEFFNTVKQEWTDRGKFKKAHEGYLMHRKDEKRSELIVLPPYLAKFRSDYHYVFHCLSQIRHSNSPDIDAYTQTPNLLRRFLEMYLGFRVPASGSFQGKLSILIDDGEACDAIARFADEGSHSQSTLRMLEYSDFPAMARGMVVRVLDALKQKDERHYAALVEATG